MNSQAVAEKDLSSSLDLIVEKIPIKGYEQVVKISHRKVKLQAIIAIHNTVLGPALGGVRMYPYASFDLALADALRLAEGMTYKSAVAEVGYGGGKSVILGDPRKDKNEELLLSFARVVDGLKGNYPIDSDLPCRCRPRRTRRAAGGRSFRSGAAADGRGAALGSRYCRSQGVESHGRDSPRMLRARGTEDHAYEDHPLPIGFGQTISQPYIVALMAQLARPSPEDRGLEVGVGSGYEAAVLAGLCKHVYGIEILDALATAAGQRLAALGYTNVSVRCGDGYQGWPEEAPFDVVLVGAAPDHVPPPLIDQLAPGGRLVIPVGGYNQELLLIEKRLDGGLQRSRVAPVQFVPMTGEASKPVDR